MRSPTFYAGLSIATSAVTIALKFGAYYVTGSVGLLSDAIESIANIVAAVAAFMALTYAAEKPDREQRSHIVDKGGDQRADADRDRRKDDDLLASDAVCERTKK